jgi:hypothetical protein
MFVFAYKLSGEQFEDLLHLLRSRSASTAFIWEFAAGVALAEKSEGSVSTLSTVIVGVRRFLAWGFKGLAEWHQVRTLARLRDRSHHRDSEVATSPSSDLGLGLTARSLPKYWRSTCGRDLA